MPIQSQPAAARRLLGADAPPALAAPTLADLPHGFFGRAGGVSVGIYASLNAGPGSRDDSAHVAENRRRVAAAFGVAPERLIGLHQVHSAEALLASAPWPGARPEADGVVTTTPGLVLSVLTADCAPVLLADVAAGVIGAAHAGWKGAFAGVLDRVVALMRQAGARRITAAIGPSIQQKSYEVGPEFQARFLAADAADARFFAPGEGDRVLFDLPGYCLARLTRLGVTATALANDTFAEEPGFFSHRRSLRAQEPDYGRNVSAIALPG